MRLIHEFNDDREAKAFSTYLDQQEIENQLEIIKNTDWGSSNYGDLTCRIWIIDEDDVEIAGNHLQAFLENPKDERFAVSKAHVAKSIQPLFNGTLPKKIRAFAPPQPVGWVTFLLITICTFIFLISMVTRKKFEPYPAEIPPQPLFSSTIEKVLFFDYPHAYTLIDRLVAAYGTDKVIQPNQLPQEGKYLLQQFLHTPYWTGIYPKLIAYMRDEFVDWDQPLFEKQRQGQYWRLISPAFMHADFLHLLINMIWLLVLGKQIEQRLGVFRLIFFILITGIISNTAQYLMSGSNFMGFSGVLCAMLAFVWIRQKKAPWEGYHLLPATIKFVAAFVVLIAVAQMISFAFEVIGTSEFTLYFANTAHIAGAFSGYALAQGELFSWK